MEKTNDVGVAVLLAEKAITKYRSIYFLCFDKGFWSRENREKIGKLVVTPVLPKKGRCNQVGKRRRKLKGI